MKRRKQLSFLLVLGEILMLFLLYQWFDFDNISIYRYSFMYLLLGYVFDRFTCSTNLIWQEGKKVCLSNSAFFLATNVMNSLRVWTLSYMWKNLSIAIIMSLFSMLYNRFLRVTFRNYFAQRVLIIGTGVHAEELYSVYQTNRFALSKVIGFVDCNHSCKVPGIHQRVLATKMPIFFYDDISAVISSKHIDEVVIALPNATKSQLGLIIDDLYEKVNVIKTTPRVNSMITFGSKVEDFDGILLLSTSSSVITTLGKIGKRSFDIIVGIIGMVLLIPLTIIVKIMSLINGDVGPLFFTQNRIGLNGKLFKMYKFRSMVLNADEILDELMTNDSRIREEYQENKKLEEDPRITKTGKFIRKTSIDEVPQFLNVLKGDMSLVGPRPYLPKEKIDMGQYYDSIIHCKPGLTGMWQTHGRSEVSFSERCKLDAFYYRNWSFWLDIIIIFRTFKTLSKKDGAF